MSKVEPFISFSESDFIEFLKEFTYFRKDIGMRKVERIKPGHGSCCTCQTCGYHHDDCVCSHNELIEYIVRHRSNGKK